MPFASAAPPSSRNIGVVNQVLEAAWVDTRCAPLYVWRIPPSPDAASLQAALHGIQQWVKTLDGPYGWIVDASELRVDIVATHRKALADHMRIVAPFSRKYCAGMSVLVTNPMFRQVATAVGWLTPWAFPTAFHASLSEADAWVREQLQAQGVGLVPRTRR